MGIAVSTSVSNNVLDAVNETMQTARNTCTADCNQSISGAQIVLNNTTAGNIQFTQRCTADASCYMNNALDQAVEVYQKGATGAAAAPSLFPGIQINTSVANNTQNIRTQLKQVLENICDGNVEQNISDPLIYATDSTVGNIGFLQEGNAYASCIMENTGRLKLQMKQEGTSTANTGAAASGIGAIIGLIIVVVVIIVIVGIIRKNQGEKPPTDGEGMPAAGSTVPGPGGKPVIPLNSSTTSRVVSRPAVTASRPAVPARPASRPSLRSIIPRKK